MAESTITKETSGLENALVQYGTIAQTSFSSGKYTLVFPKAFGSDPVIVASANAGATNSVTTVGVSGVSEAQVTLQLVRATGGSMSTPDLIVRWIAIGPRP